MANYAPCSAILVLIFQLLVLRPRPTEHGHGHGKAVQAVLYQDCIITFQPLSLSSPIVTDVKIFQLPNGLLDMDKPFKLFDMKKFQQNVNREMKRQFPERNKLETQVRNFDLVSL